MDAIISEYNEHIVITLGLKWNNSNYWSYSQRYSSIESIYTTGILSYPIFSDNIFGNSREISKSEAIEIILSKNLIQIPLKNI